MKTQKYKFFKYSENGVIEKECVAEIKNDEELKKLYEEKMGLEFDPETSYIKPVIDRKQQKYSLELLSQLVFDAAANLLYDVKNKYAVADDLFELSEIIGKVKTKK